MRLKQKIWLLLGLVVILILCVDLGISYFRIRAEMHAQTEFDARTIYGFMMATRRIYQQQFIASGLPVNEKTVGFLPAHSFSRIAKDFANWNDSGVLFNNVSDRPRNPNNRADHDELAAMEWFRTYPGATERMDDIVDARGKGYLLYTAPIWVEPFCMKCHGEREDAPPSIRNNYAESYGYKVGDLRGVVSIKIPMAKIDERFRSVWGAQAAKSLIGYAILFFVIGLLIDRLVTNRLVRLQASAESIASGDYATRLGPIGKDEICDVARSFNRMAEAIQKDITAREKAEAEIQRLAYYDSLTNLPNRSLLMDRLALALAVAQRHDRVGALIIFNLDRFKNLNDVHGHEQGDLLLVAVGGRLAGLLREGDTLARIAADEFAILLQDLGARREQASRRVLAIVGKVHADMQLPFRFGDEEAVLSASLGVTLIPESDEDIAKDVLRRADTALHRAKEAGGNQTAFFDSDMGVAARQRYQIERELRKAIPTGELRLFLQPQVNVQGRTVGAETLVRWQHPERGLLAPGAFISIAEESDLIVDLGYWVLSETCRLMARETMAGYPLRLSVNISPRQFRQGGFVSWVKDLLAVTGADPTQLTMEVTEGLVIEDIDLVVAKMSELTAMGIHFSIDDFGTGYSSLSYLKRMPIHELKIDKSFIQDAPVDPNDAALVETILSVARHLHLQVVAEGVETKEQVEFLNQHGTVIFQGYLYGKPAPAEEWLARWRAGRQPSGFAGFTEG
jgi:diguanylate cyclase (GGDEF)-like protein